MATLVFYVSADFTSLNSIIIHRGKLEEIIAFGSSLREKSPLSPWQKVCLEKPHKGLNAQLVSFSEWTMRQGTLKENNKETLLAKLSCNIYFKNEEFLTNI